MKRYLLQGSNSSSSRARTAGRGQCKAEEGDSAQFHPAVAATSAEAEASLTPLLLSTTVGRDVVLAAAIEGGAPAAVAVVMQQGQMP
jgi:hypothetical protein